MPGTEPAMLRPPLFLQDGLPTSIATYRSAGPRLTPGRELASKHPLTPPAYPTRPAEDLIKQDRDLSPILPI
jgi:hypothetical protein